MGGADTVGLGERLVHCAGGGADTLGQGAGLILTLGSELS